MYLDFCGFNWENCKINKYYTCVTALKKWYSWQLCLQERKGCPRSATARRRRGEGYGRKGSLELYSLPSTGIYTSNTTSKHLSNRIRTVITVAPYLLWEHKASRRALRLSLSPASVFTSPLTIVHFLCLFNNSSLPGLSGSTSSPST